MSRKAVGINAFTPEYLEALKERDETEAGAEPESGTPLVLREKEGKFALFRPWKSFEAGDSPEAEFDTREDALRFLAARGALSRPRPYEIESAAGRMAEGFTLKTSGRESGRLRTFDPDWVFGANLLASTAHSSEDLAALVSTAGPERQRELGEILVRQEISSAADETGENGAERS
ncbi:MAG TPA: hypothetical protein VLE27_12675 [Thermoanaerobaculia bacterium]|nr:hypothetical protein [Thermoanaerobaculia bacterium]